jgi:hypothetical protein
MMFSVNALMQHFSLGSETIFVPLLLKVDQGVLPFAKQRMLQCGNLD